MNRKVMLGKCLGSFCVCILCIKKGEKPHKSLFLLGKADFFLRRRRDKRLEASLPNSLYRFIFCYKESLLCVQAGYFSPSI